MKRADTEIIKPLLIYNYESTSHRKQKEFFDLMMRKGDQFEAAFAGASNEGDRKSILAIINEHAAHQHENAQPAEVLDGHRPSSLHEGGQQHALNRSSGRQRNEAGSPPIDGAIIEMTSRSSNHYYGNANVDGGSYPLLQN